MLEGFNESDRNDEGGNEKTEVAKLFSVFADDCKKNGLNAEAIIPPDWQQFAVYLSQSIEQLFIAEPNTSAAELRHFLFRLCGMQFHIIENQGYMSVLYEFTVPGAQKPGYFILAILPPGLAAPAHLHRGTEGMDLAGEYTITLKGELKYAGDEGKIESHDSRSPVRVSAVGSTDRCLPQENLWVGMYIQPVRCLLE